jgi:hypothetical protein
MAGRHSVMASVPGSSQVMAQTSPGAQSESRVQGA